MGEASNPNAKTSSRLIILLIFLIPCVLVLTALAFWLSLKMELNGKLAKLRAQGVPTTPKELDAYYAIPDGEADATEAWLRALQAAKIASAAPAAKSLPIIGTSKIVIPPPGEDWSQLDEVRQFLSDHSAQMKIIHDADQTPGGVRFPVDFSKGFETVLNEVQGSRGVSRLLQLDAYVQAHDGHDQEALQDVRGIFALSESLRHEPILISHLVRIAIFATGGRTLEVLLPSSDWKEDDLSSLRNMIAKIDHRHSLERAVNGDLPLTLQHFEITFPEPVRLIGLLASLDRYAIFKEHFNKPWPHYEAADKLIDDRLQSNWTYRLTPGVRVLLSGQVVGWMTAQTRAIAYQRAMLALIDAQRFRLKEGRLPESMEELEAAFPSTTPEEAEQRIDPFGGAPLKLISNEKGIVIYSIGEDGVDDGGHLPREEKAKDLGYTLPR